VDLDMAEATVAAPAGEAAAPKSKKGKLIIILALTVLLLAGGGVAAWLALGGGHHAKKTEQVKKEPLAPPQYVALDPPFVVNFESEQQVRFLQVTAQVMSRDPVTVELLKTNDPVVRNDLLMLFGGQKYEIVSTREGKEALRTQTLAAVRKIVAEAGGKPEKVEAVYFTSFVMQ
jgi:flagellar FliL protein